MALEALYKLDFCKRLGVCQSMPKRFISYPSFIHYLFYICLSGFQLEEKTSFGEASS